MWISIICRGAERGSTSKMMVYGNGGSFTMANTPAVLTGVVHGTTIELDRSPGFSDGQQVTVILQPVPATEQRMPPGEGIRRSAGAWADDPEGLEEYMEWNRQQRKVSWHRPLGRDRR
jgi:hypothetical protein